MDEIMGKVISETTVSSETPTAQAAQSQAPVQTVSQVLEKEAGAVPTLTLEPFGMDQGPADLIVAEEKKEPVYKGLDDSGLTDAEKKMVDDFAKQIDIKKSTVVVQYGSNSQQKISSFAETVLSTVKTKDIGETGDLLAGVVAELRGFEEEEKGVKGWFKRPINKLQNLRVKYDKAENNINQIIKVLENHQVTLLKDIAMFDKMYDLNLTYFKEVTMYILAGKKKLHEERTTTLKALVDKAQASGLPEDAQAARDMDAMCNRFEKKIHDLELSRTVSMQTAPQIRLVQNNDTTMVEKIQSTIVNTIPLWKTQMVLALGTENAMKATQAQRNVTDMTNELLRKNADALKMATVETAKESERGIVDMETLRHTNESLISTLDEVINIQKEGRARRAEAEVELQKLENELKTKLLEIPTV